METEAPAKDSPTIVIEQGGHGFFATLGELWRYRELFSFLAWRDISIRYKQTIFGVLWVLFQPLFSTAIFVAIKILFLTGKNSFGSIDILAQVAVVLCGMVCWNLFAQSLSYSSLSLLKNPTLVTKVYCPRIILPLSSALTALVDFAVGLVLVGVMIGYCVLASPGSTQTGINLLALPLLVILCLMLAMGLGLFFAAINVRFRDVKLILVYLIQIGMHISATWWTLGDVPEKYRFFVSLNPLVGIMEGFRWALIGGPFPGNALVLSVGVAIVILGVGYAFFMKMERSFADVI